jgi:four helix bundle protein
VSGEQREDLRARLKAYALGIIDLYVRLPKNDVARVLGRQFLRSGTSIGAHHREAHRARSTAEFISKMETGLQELDETDYWLDLLISSENAPAEAEAVGRETQELISIFTASVKTAKRRGDR